MRPVYRRRRDALLAALARRLPWLEPSGISAGLHLVTWLPPHLDETTVVEAALRAGVDIDAVGPYRIPVQVQAVSSSATPPPPNRRYPRV
jgi:GntR family transcriptional regulator/MocR family aminotransferase